MKMERITLEKAFRIYVDKTIAGITIKISDYHHPIEQYKKGVLFTDGTGVLLQSNYDEGYSEYTPGEGIQPADVWYFSGVDVNNPYGLQPFCK